MCNDFLLSTNFDLKESQKNFIHKKIESLKFFLSQEEKIDLVIKKRKFSYRAEFCLKKGNNLIIKEVNIDSDIGSVINSIIENIENKLRDNFRNRFSYQLAKNISGKFYYT